MTEPKFHHFFFYLFMNSPHNTFNVLKNHVTMEQRHGNPRPLNHTTIYLVLLHNIRISSTVFHNQTTQQNELVSAQLMTST